MPNWTEHDLPDLTGQHWLITGATHGIGLETAKMAAAAGARLTLAVRSVERGRRIANRLGNTDVLHLDLDSLAVTSHAAQQASAVDVLISNAGLSTNKQETTVDGFERIWQVNFLAPFLFTNWMLPKVSKRVVILGSVAHQWGTLNLEDPNFDHRPWVKRTAYAQSKLADMLWGYELARQLHTSNRQIDVQIAHPGWAATKLGTPAVSNPLLERIAGNILLPLIGQTARQGALPILYAATQPLPNGSYIGPNGRFQTQGTPVICKRTSTARDPHLAAKLWAYATQTTAPWAA